MRARNKHAWIVGAIRVRDERQERAASGRAHSSARARASTRLCDEFLRYRKTPASERSMRARVARRALDPRSRRPALGLAHDERARARVAQGALAQAVQEHREWVKFDNLTQEHGPALQRVFFVLFLISLPSFQPWIPEPEFALLAAESELGLSWGASCGILQILQVEYRNSSRSLTMSLTRQYRQVR